MKIVIKRKARNRLLLTIVFCLSLSTVFGQEVLDNFLVVAAKNNPKLKALYAQYSASFEKVAQVGTLPDPMLGFGYFITPVETRLGPQQAKASVSQMFPWFGTLNAKEGVASEMAKAKLEAYMSAKNQLFFDVKCTYFNLYVISKAIERTAESLALLGSFKRLATIKFEIGKVGMADALQVEIENKELENQLAFLKNREVSLQAKFTELLNVAKQLPIAFPDTLWHEDINIEKSAALDSIILRNPDLKKMEIMMTSLSKQIDVARKQGMPSFTLGMTYININERTDMNVPDNGMDAIILPQVGLKIPLYRKKYRSMVKEVEFQREVVQYEKESSANHFKAGFEKVYNEFLDAQRNVKLYVHLTTLAREALNILITEYASAGKDFETLLHMERKLLTYKLELEKARADQNTAVAYMKYLMGSG